MSPLPSEYPSKRRSRSASCAYKLLTFDLRVVATPAIQKSVNNATINALCILTYIYIYAYIMDVYLPLFKCGSFMVTQQT